MVVRWASSHNNTFTWAIVAGTDGDWFRHSDYCELRLLYPSTCTGKWVCF